MMNEKKRTESIDALVAGYLKAGAEGIDAGGLLSRARRSVRMKRLRRRVGVITGIAAALVVGVLGFLFTSAPQADPPRITAVPLVAQSLQRQAEQAGSGAQSILIGLDESVDRATGEILDAVSTHETPNFSNTLLETKETLEADARYVKTKAENVVSDSLRKAGLVI